jgi:hypothetical protein
MYIYITARYRVVQSLRGLAPLGTQYYHRAVVHEGVVIRFWGRQFSSPELTAGSSTHHEPQLFEFRTQERLGPQPRLKEEVPRGRVGHVFTKISDDTVSGLQVLKSA